MNRPVVNRKASVSISPAPEGRARYGHIGLIATLCFVVGVSWPFLAGVQLVPSAPVDNPEPSQRNKPAPDPTTGAAAGPPISKKPRIEIDKTVVINCHDAKGRKQNRCDKPNVQAALGERLAELAACKPDAEGTLSLGLKLDFEKNAVLDVVRGKSTTVDQETAGELLACAKAQLESVSLAGVEHLYRSYLVFFFLQLHPPGTPIVQVDEQGQPNAIVPANGSATVIFESAMVRDHADEAGKVVARLLYGTRVFVTGRLGDWYEVKYDSKGRKGFVHKNALGME